MLHALTYSPEARGDLEARTTYEDSACVVAYKNNQNNLLSRLANNNPQSSAAGENLPAPPHVKKITPMPPLLPVLPPVGVCLPWVCVLHNLPTSTTPQLLPDRSLSDFLEVQEWT